MRGLCGSRSGILEHMNIKHHTHPDQLERYSFLWSEARLVIAAFALFLGGVPPIIRFFPGMFALTRPLLTISWVISGVAAAYLLYRWNQDGQRLFGAKEGMDLYAFVVLVVSGLNLGITGIAGINIGMSISSSRPIFVLVGVLYLIAGWRLWQRWQANHSKLF